MIILHDIQSRLAEMKELVGQRAFHPFLIKNIQTPFFDEDKILLLLSMFDQLNLPDYEKQTYITATLLIQLALDTHDQVQIDSIEDDLKGQQLTVLAGDYFSGLYYKHLASVNNIQLIRELSNSIKEINEQKIFLHEHNYQNSTKQILDNLRKIEGSLYVKLADFFQISNWNEFTEVFLLAKRLLLERERFLTTGTSVSSEAVKKTFLYQEQRGKELSDELHNNIVQFFDQSISQSIELVNKLAKKLPNINKLLLMRIQALKDEHQAVVKTFVEEG
ncbi:heptaprenyl diphosphate synthase component 1 [Bacillus marasmi]|uniref:heptaprenyl diphosphate synthase component 1 n=1 Tax=Bacillus marasmi TaxID=1926279 RepID=UPI0011C8A161|nr:heptaprenyl diphosphate synthase component 1 [Bacillus marasmi]